MRIFVRVKKCKRDEEFECEEAVVADSSTIAVTKGRALEANEAREDAPIPGGGR